MSEINLIYLEMIAVRSIDGDVLDPEKDVPFACLWETQGTLYSLTQEYS